MSNMKTLYQEVENVLGVIGDGRTKQIMKLVKKHLPEKIENQDITEYVKVQTTPYFINELANNLEQAAYAEGWNNAIERMTERTNKTYLEDY